ncbi:MAG: hypothetical protein AAF311_16640, partial [Pseudomonadota bacterium]
MERHRLPPFFHCRIALVGFAGKAEAEMKGHVLSGGDRSIDRLIDRLLIDRLRNSSVPLYPMEHQYLVTEEVPEIA